MATSATLTLTAAPDVATAPLAVLCDILGGTQRPGRHIRMQPPGAPEKYVTVKRNGHNLPISDAALQAHIDGRATYGGPLIGADGLARALVIELDVDAMAGARRVQAAAASFGVEMISIVVKGAGTHDGSHNWARTTPCDPKTARALAKQIAMAAGYPAAETYPTETGIRYPLGVHTHTQRRGCVLLSSGEILDADDAAERVSAWAALAALVPVTPPPLPKPTTKALPERRVTLGEHAAERLDGPGAIARFNAMHTPAAILESHGAEATRDGYTCPCGADHGPGTKITIGYQVAYCHSDNPGCLLSKSRYPRGLDAWALEAALSYSGSTVAMLKAVNPLPRTRQKAQEPPLPPMPDYLTKEVAERRAKDRERKRAQRQSAAAARKEAALDWLNDHDDHLSRRDRRVALIHLELIGQRICHTASLARLATMYAERFTSEAASESTIRTIQRANERLIELGLLARTVRSTNPATTHETAVWTLAVAPVSRIETPQTECDRVTPTVTQGDHGTSNIPTQEELASGGGGSPPGRARDATLPACDAVEPQGGMAGQRRGPPGPGGSVADAPGGGA